MSFRQDDMGADYVEKRNDYFNAVTLEDLQRVATRIHEARELHLRDGRQAERRSARCFAFSRCFLCPPSRRSPA